MVERRAIFAIIGMAVLAGCGRVAPLTPAAGGTLPPPAFGETERSDAATLLAPSAQARPALNDELLAETERPADDRFDRPPDAQPGEVPTPEAPPAPETFPASNAD